MSVKAEKLAEKREENEQRVEAIADYLSATAERLHYDQVKGVFLYRSGTTISTDKGIHRRMKAALRGLGAEKIPSKISLFLEQVVATKSVTHHGPIAGRKTGDLVSLDGGKWLVSSEAKHIKPRKGEWNNFHRLLESLLGEDQALVWHAWHQEQLKACRSGRHVPAPILACVGGTADGKSFAGGLSSTLRGGRTADPLKAWTGSTPSWSDHLLGTECLTIDDANHREDYRGRAELASAIKSAIYNPSVTIDKRNTTSFTLRPAWGVMMMCNSDGSAIRVLPDPDIEGFHDKIIILQTSPAEILYREEGSDADEKRLQIYLKELPAYAHFLLNEFVIPEELPSGMSRVRGGLLFRNFESLMQLRGASPEGELETRIKDLVDTYGPVVDQPVAAVRDRLAGPYGNYSLPKHNITLGQQLGKIEEWPRSYVRKGGKMRSGAWRWTLCDPDDENPVSTPTVTSFAGEPATGGSLRDAVDPRDVGGA